MLAEIDLDYTNNNAEDILMSKAQKNSFKVTVKVNRDDSVKVLESALANSYGDYLTKRVQSRLRLHTDEKVTLLFTRIEKQVTAPEYKKFFSDCSASRDLLAQTTFNYLHPDFCKKYPNSMQWVTSGDNAKVYSAKWSTFSEKGNIAHLNQAISIVQHLDWYDCVVI